VRKFAPPASIEAEICLLLKEKPREVFLPQVSFKTPVLLLEEKKFDTSLEWTHVPKKERRVLRPYSGSKRPSAVKPTKDFKQTTSKKKLPSQPKKVEKGISPKNKGGKIPVDEVYFKKYLVYLSKSSDHNQMLDRVHLLRTRRKLEQRHEEQLALAIEKYIRLNPPKEWETTNTLSSLFKDDYP